MLKIVGWLFGRKRNETQPAHSNFRRGQRVCCVADEWNPPQGWLGTLPVRGCVYLIEGFSELGFLKLVEIPNDRLGHWAAFHPGFFRPVRDTDISVFTKLLETPPVKERESAL